MRTLLAVALVTVALAGCADQSADEAPEVVVDPVDDGAEPENNPTFGPHSGLPRTLDETATRSLAEAPEWVLGEWWKIRLTSFFDGKVTEVVRVVSGVEQDDYLVGMPQDAFNNEVMVLHVPGFGLVNKDTHGFEAHDVLFEPLQFPLEAGNSWETFFESTNAQVTAVVDRVEGGKAYIDFSGARSINITYDAAMGAIEKMTIGGYGEYEVLDHGYDHTGMVTVPYKHDLIFFNGRLAGAVDLSQPIIPPSAAGPTETITIPDEYDRVSFSTILGDLITGGAAPADPGYYEVTATAPDGTEFKSTKMATEGPIKIESFSHDQPAGDWNLQAVAAGPGVAFLEGIAYIVYDVAMPEGCVVLTNRIHNHGGECGGHVHGLE